ncbi:hypothetical protein FXO37_17028 [Capsicum annuum]|nr:hypothetical protein FXO37_17028 [Capsicum annuum]
MAGKMSIALFVLLVVFLTQNQVSRAKVMVDEQQQQQRNNQLIVNQDARIVAQRHHIRSRACFSARNVVQSVCVFLLVPMGISKLALATTTGRPREVAQKVTRAEEGDRNPAPVPSPFLLIFLLSNKRLSWNYTTYNIKIGVAAKHKTSQIWTPSAVPPQTCLLSRNFCKMRSRTKL